MSDKAWFQEGLRFQCSGCGDCCTGAPGFVWVNSREIRLLAEAVGLSKEEFEATYVRRIGVRKSLIEYDDGDCVLFDPDQRQCTAYEARPRQCRTWPFWESTAGTREDWEETCRECPGCGKGPLVPAKEVTRRIGVIRV
jgi:Fe-S-cluster containining protein